MAYGLPSWLGGSSEPSPPTSTAPKTQDGGFVAPDRNRRELCYESRDIFFECLDKNDILDANKEDEKSRKVCPTEVTDYERDCARSWVGLCGLRRIQASRVLMRSIVLGGIQLRGAKWLTCGVLQIKYFKEKRVVDWQRDQQIKQIKKEDAEQAARAKSGKRGGFFSS
jgi:cytochrome c oxidase assembly factor 6